MNIVAREVYRKFVHMILSLLLMLPYFCALPQPLNIYSYYALGLFAAAALNAVAAKRMVLRRRLAAFRGDLRTHITSLGDQLRGPLKAFEEAMESILNFVEQQIELLERDYEKREGYVGLLYGMIGGVISLLLSPCHALYGLLAIAVVDPVASLSNLAMGREKSLAGDALAALAYCLLLLGVGVPAAESMLLSLIAALAEYLSPEDNLTIPVFTTLAALALDLPARCPP
uniref:Phosphatidate cytidylyltransferase n=1 Tax=Thermofilum pendens TaxID=2269 RepID=A0A7C1T5E4_THEPE